MKKNYLIIITTVNIFASILFFSNIGNSKEASILLLLGGLFLTFLEWKKDNYRVKDFIDRFF